MTWAVSWLQQHAVPQIVVMASADPLLVLLNYGGLGLGILLFISGQLHGKAEVEDLKDQRDRLAKDLSDLQKQIMGQTFPTLGNMTRVLEATQQRFERPSVSDQDLLRQVLDELRRRDERH